MDLWPAVGIRIFNTSKFSASEKNAAFYRKYIPKKVLLKSAQKWNFSMNFLYKSKKQRDFPTKSKSPNAKHCIEEKIPTVTAENHPWSFAKLIKTSKSIPSSRVFWNEHSTYNQQNEHWLCLWLSNVSIRVSMCTVSLASKGCVGKIELRWMKTFNSSFWGLKSKLVWASSFLSP